MELNKYIDHTLLKADAKKEDILKLCEEAKNMTSCLYALIHAGFLL